MSSKTSIQVRKASRDIDGEAVHRLIDSVIERSSKEWMVHISKLKSYETAMKAGFIINETYIVIFSTETPWFMDGSVLTEQFVGKIYPDGSGTMKDVCDFLTEEAKARQCLAVIAGSLVAPSSRGVQRLYEREGFTLEGVQMVKVLR